MYESDIGRSGWDMKRDEQATVPGANSGTGTPVTIEGRSKVLASEPVALPPELAQLTEILPATDDKWWERFLIRAGLSGIASRSLMLRRGWALFRRAPRFGVVVTLGDLEGLSFAALERLRGNRRPVHVMYDCLWYGGSWLRRAWMRFCLRTVDRCIVWASVERKRYARVYEVPEEKFLFVPHHHTLKRFNFEVGDDGYVFTGGNSDRDYRPFLDAVRDLQVPCVLATNRRRLFAGLTVPPNVRVVSASHAEFRQLMARARMVVMPMQANLLRTGGQQTVLNAMYMGKPVILTDPEGGSDYIENGKTGMLVPYGDVSALRQAIRFLLDHPEEARAMGERARLAAAPLTTQHCNELIWADALRLAEDRGRTAVRSTHTPSEVGKAEKNSLGNQV